MFRKLPILYVVFAEGVVVYILRSQKPYRLYELIGRYFEGDPIVTQFESSVFEVMLQEVRKRKNPKIPYFFVKEKI